jgi:transglutaminase-like putative cysteine protease
VAAPIRYRVSHETTYKYTSPVDVSRQIAHLSPRESSWQKVLSHKLVVEPRPSERSEGVDYFGNSYSSIMVDTPHDALVVRAESEVIVSPHAPAPGSASPPWESALATPGVWGLATKLDVEQYRVPSPAVPVINSTRDYARRNFTDKRPWMDAMLELTQCIRREFKYDTKATTVSTSVEEVLELRGGVCQDFAHLMLSCLRSLGLPARYVSGYVLNRRRDGKDSNAGADASHAWVASYCPAHGWVAFDPTNGKIADTEFVTLGWGREYHDVSPLRGVVRGAAEQKLAVAVSVVPVESAASA